MKSLFLISFVAVIIFLLCKIILVIVSKIFNNALNIKEENRNKFDFSLSLVLQLCFIIVWAVCVDSVWDKYNLTSLEFYIAFCLIGIFCVVWCYFSWDAEHIFVKPHIASDEDKRIKKSFTYLLIFIFVIVQGYHQTLHLLDNTYEINILFSITNNSIIVATISLDRIMNQICSK